MKVLLINQFFYPDLAPTGQLMTDLAIDLTKKGCQVSVITGRWSYGGKLRKFSRYEKYEGVQIFRTFSSCFGRRYLTGRIVDYLTFFAASFFKGLMIDRSDVIICLSTPPWISLTGLLLKWIKRCKLISWIQDLYPEVAARLGLLREKGWVYKIIEKVSTGILKKAERLVVLSSSMRERLIQKGINPAKVEVVFNWANGRKLFPLLSEKNGFLEKWNLQGKFIVLYSGNMGRCHHFETLLPVIQQLESVQNILFIFIGDGFGNETLRKFRDNHHLKNIHFLPYQKHEDLAKSLSVGDVHLVTLKEGMQDLMVPSKVYSSMAVGRPIIYIGPQAGEVPRILGESQCGWAVKIGDHERLKEYILRLYQDHSLVQALGQQARQFFENNFEQKLSTEKFYICLKEVLKN